MSDATVANGTNGTANEEGQWEFREDLGFEVSITDPFKWASGLPDDVDVTFLDATFRTDAEYRDGQVLCLAVEWKAADPDIDTERPLLFACGNGWEAKNRGAVAVKEKPTARPRYNRNSAMAQLFDAAMASGADEELRRRMREQKLTIYHAALWRGLRFHMTRQEKDYGGEIGKRDRLLPEKFLGVVGDGAGAGGGGSSTQTSSSSATTASTGVLGHSVPVPAPMQQADPAPATATAPANPQVGAPSGNGDGAGGAGSNGLGALGARLRQAARAATTFEGFVDAAFVIDGVDGNPAAEEAVLDQGPNGIWATSRQG